MKNKNIYLISLFLLIPLCFNACKKPDFGNPQVSSTLNPAKVIFVNTVPDASSITLLANNSPVGNPLIFGANQTYSNLIANSEQLKVKNVIFKASPTDTLAKSADLINYTPLVGGISYTIFLTDSLKRPFGKGTGFSKDNGGARFLQVTDTLTAPAAGNAKVRFFHLSPNSPAVGIFNTDNNAQVFSVRKYRDATNPYIAFTQIPAGTYNLDVRTGAVSPAVLTLPGVVLAPGKIYTIYAYGLLKSGSFPLNAAIITHN